MHRRAVLSVPQLLKKRPHYARNPTPTLGRGDRKLGKSSRDLRDDSQWLQKCQGALKVPIITSTLRRFNLRLQWSSSRFTEIQLSTQQPSSPSVYILRPTKISLKCLALDKSKLGHDWEGTSKGRTEFLHASTNSIFPLLGFGCAVTSPGRPAGLQPPARLPNTCCCRRYWN